jgi:hypothetical protein
MVSRVQDIATAFLSNDLLVHLIEIQGSEGYAHVVQLLLGFDAKGAFGERKPGRCRRLAW